MKNSFAISVPKTDDWTFGDYFEVLEPSVRAQRAIERGRLMLAEARISEHKFFVYAARSQRALAEWASQECTVTNHFSMALLSIFARIKNVHIRSMLLPIATGEHSAVKKGVAHGAHPHLLAKLISDMSIVPEKVKPLPFTDEFIVSLFCEGRPLSYCLGLLCVGNEALVREEYTAVEMAFAANFPRDVYRPFLRANIEEDDYHAGLLDEAASFVLQSEEDCENYVIGAGAGLEARKKYYDSLLLHLVGEVAN